MADNPAETNDDGLREDQKPANQTGMQNGNVKQRSGHTPKNTDLARGSEPETRGSSQQRG
ncbi:MAG: hypothetical protein CL820_00450 [Croceicoccus sp.]|nr:hypothetical protein [Croceicoccus sp.]MAL24358.1 hypothetical protein [Croceicoccus sp.]|tara:strand:+ start:76518 stop:76697 length:180 start_codon:yes stop_codon:yes gene_type:complete